MDQQCQQNQRRSNAHRDVGHHHRGTTFNTTIQLGRRRPVVGRSQILLPLHKLLTLMPRFRDTLATLTSDNKSATLPVNLTERGTDPSHEFPETLVKIVIKGRNLHNCIIDGRSAVNVISEAKCQNLGLTQWELCPFWLQMADTRSVRQ